jgi:hypothetical protein
MIEDALWLFLTTAPRQTQAAVGQKVYPLLIPQDVQGSAVAYQTVATPERGLDHAGASGWVRRRIQFSCQAARPSQARAIADAITQDLHGFQGAIGAYTVAYCSVDGDTDTAELFDAAVRRVDVEILYKE